MGSRGRTGGHANTDPPDSSTQTLLPFDPLRTLLSVPQNTIDPIGRFNSSRAWTDTAHRLAGSGPVIPPNGLHIRSVRSYLAYCFRRYGRQPPIIPTISIST